MNKLTAHISREILKSYASDSTCYASWMRKYLSAKEYYFIKNQDLNSISVNNLKQKIDIILKDSNLRSDLNLIEYLIRENTKLGIILKIIRSGFYGNFSIKANKKINLLLQILIYRIRKSPYLNLINTPFLSSIGLNPVTFHIISPVCPDYSYINTKDGRYMYTFESMGDGIGLVAKKAIFNFSILDSISKDLIANGLKLEFQILIGDFEAHKQNLESLNESQSSFLRKIKISCQSIYNKTGIKTDLFTSLSLGLKGWKYQIDQIKNMNHIYEFKDLYTLLPEINHEKRLISRLTLYKKWFGESADYKRIFFNQTLEYMLMGNLVSDKYKSNAIILASDHRAMRDYYSSISKIGVISSSSEY